MNKFFLQLNILVIFATLTFQGCMPIQSGASRANTATEYSNSPSSVPAFSSYVLMTNPSAQEGSMDLDADISLTTYLYHTPQYITNNQYLINNQLKIKDQISGVEENLTNISYKVMQIKDENTLTPMTYNTWAFEPHSHEFVEVNSFYHLTKQIKKFQESLKFIHTISSYVPLGGNFPYHSSIPTDLFEKQKNWPTSPYTVYTRGLDEINAAFYPSDFEMSIGYDKEITGRFLTEFSLATDPSIIYHETGHAFVHIMMNLRNHDQTGIGLSRLGTRFYDEAGAINEGIADYFSYAMTGRTHFAEWALGNFYGASRPISEDEEIHAHGISSTPGEKLSYPAFITYEANAHDQIIEDIHNGGMIASHYLTALTLDIQLVCSFDHEKSTNIIIALISETLSELGDLTGSGVEVFRTAYDEESNKSFVNLNKENAKEWIESVNPITYRSFFRTFARKLRDLLSTSHFQPDCSQAYNNTRIEQLLDEYGLLLFRSYNSDGNGDDPYYDPNDDSLTPQGFNYTSDQVSSLNQLKSVMIKKDHLILDPSSSASTAYVFDNRVSIKSIMDSYMFSGAITSDSLATHLIDNDFSYNNANGRISPGEVVGISLNLFNNSNSPMAGIEVLANDWDHANPVEDKACRVFNGFTDTWPTDTEGAATVENTTPQTVENSCNHTTTDNSTTAPVCFVLYSGEDSTQWISQKQFMYNIGLPSKNCLGGQSGEYDDCFIRAVKGADYSYFSKLDPQRNWSQTITADGDELIFTPSNLIYFEVNPWIPPGTRFNCRLRTRFTNCDDCFNRKVYDENGKEFYDDYQDYQYSGAQPFKIINFQFSVVD